MLTITKEAREKIIFLAELEGKTVLRASVNAGGCSGFVYSLEWVEDYDLQDSVFPVSPGILVAVDPESREKLEGAILTYSEGLQGAGFSWNNPNATRTCGCQKSFS